MDNNEQGKLTFIYGTMGAGKTSMLIKDVMEQESQNKEVGVYSTIIDSVACPEAIRSRDGSSYLNVWSFKNFGNIPLDAVFIDECQFLTDEQVIDLKNYAKRESTNVTCYGLLKDFQNKTFEGSEALLMLADESIEIEHRCSCGALAKCNARYVNGEFTTQGEQKVINDKQDVTYEALCEKCYKIECLKELPVYRDCLARNGEKKANQLVNEVVEDLMKEVRGEQKAPTPKGACKNKR